MACRKTDRCGRTHWPGGSHTTATTKDRRCYWCNWSSDVCSSDLSSSSGRAPGYRAKAAWLVAKLTDAAGHTGGVVATARRQGCTAQLEKPSSSHAEMRGAAWPYNWRHREVG